jgi:hypothetical protein
MSGADASGTAPLSVAAVAVATATSAKDLQEAAHTGILSSTEDLVAELSQLGAGGDSSDKAVQAVADAAAASGDAAAPAECQQPLHLTPEEEAAVSECVQQFVGLYEQVSGVRRTVHPARHPPPPAWTKPNQCNPLTASRRPS